MPSWPARERRVAMLRRVTDLFLSNADHLNEQQLGVFGEVLVRLIERVENKALEQLSTSLATVDGAPTEAIRRLAYHTAISVAGPVLKGSSRIDDRDLVAIARSRGQDHLLAISERQIVSADVTDALLRRDDARVTNALAGNGGARFSTSGYDTMVKRAEGDEALGLRLDLPPQILRQLLLRATDAVRARLLAIGLPDRRERIDAVLGTLADSFGRAKPDAAQYNEAESFVRALNRSGKLTDSAVNRLAIERETARIIVAIAVCCAAKPDTIEPLMLSARTEGLVVACRGPGTKLANRTNDPQEQVPGNRAIACTGRRSRRRVRLAIRVRGAKDDPLLGGTNDGQEDRLAGRSRACRGETARIAGSALSAAFPCTSSLSTVPGAGRAACSTFPLRERACW